MIKAQLHHEYVSNYQCSSVNFRKFNVAFGGQLRPLLWQYLRAGKCH